MQNSSAGRLGFLKQMISHEPCSQSEKKFLQKDAEISVTSTPIKMFINENFTV